MANYVTEYIHQAWPKEKPSSKHVLSELSYFADLKGQAAPSLDTIVKRTGLSLRTVQTVLRAQQKAGHILIEQGQGVQCRYGKTNRYTFIGFTDWHKLRQGVQSDVVPAIQGVQSSASETPETGQGVQSETSRGAIDVSQGVQSSAALEVLKDKVSTEVKDLLKADAFNAAPQNSTPETPVTASELTAQTPSEVETAAAGEAKTPPSTPPPPSKRKRQSKAKGEPTPKRRQIPIGKSKKPLDPAFEAVMLHIAEYTEIDPDTVDEDVARRFDPLACHVSKEFRRMFENDKHLSVIERVTKGFPSWCKKTKGFHHPLEKVAFKTRFTEYLQQYREPIEQLIYDAENPPAPEPETVYATDEEIADVLAHFARVAGGEWQ